MSITKKYKLYAGNPEFTRNLWQELTLQRLLAIPVILFLLYMLAKYAIPEGRFASSLMLDSVITFFLVGFFWGGKLVSDSLAQEFTDGTWDSQRISGLSAMQLVAGKFFGGTIIVWYTLIFLLGFFIYASILHGDIAFLSILKIVLLLVFVTLTIHGLVMSSLLASWRKQAHRATKNIRFAVALPFLVGLVLACSLGFYLYLLDSFLLSNFVYWFAWELDLLTLFLLLAFSSACWVCIGVWQQMRSELQFNTQPWWWLGFLAFWLFFCFGLMNDNWDRWFLFFGNKWLVYVSVCLSFVIFSTYFQLYYANKNSMYWLRFSAALKRKDYKALGNFFPAWLTSYIVALILSAVLIVLSVWQWDYHEIFSIIALMLFILRDVLLNIWLNLTKDGKRADSTWLFYLVILYVLLPWILEEVTFESSQFLFYSNTFITWTGESYPAWFVLAPLVQVGVMIILVKLRWRKITMVNAV